MVPLGDGDDPYGLHDGNHRGLGRGELQACCHTECDAGCFDDNNIAFLERGGSRKVSTSCGQVDMDLAGAPGLDSGGDELRQSGSNTDGDGHD